MHLVSMSNVTLLLCAERLKQHSSAIRLVLFELFCVITRLQFCESFNFDFLSFYKSATFYPLLFNVWRKCQLSFVSSFQILDEILRKFVQKKTFRAFQLHQVDNFLQLKRTLFVQLLDCVLKLVLRNFIETFL